MEKGVTTGSSFPNYGWIYDFGPDGSIMFGHLGKVSLVDDELTAIFTGKEGIVSGGVCSGTPSKGTYSDYMPALLKYPSLVGSWGNRSEPRAVYWHVPSTRAGNSYYARNRTPLTGGLSSLWS